MKAQLKRIVSLSPAILLAGTVLLLRSTHATASNTAAYYESTLSGTMFNGMMPRGESEYRQYTDTNGKTQSILEVEFGRISAPDGTQITIKIDSVSIGKVTLKNKCGGLVLRTRMGDPVPDVYKGDIIYVTANGKVILTGKY